MDFPNYNSNSSAAVQMYLHGELGSDPILLNPYMCSSFYAVDRFINYIQKYAAYFKNDDNTVILSDRYLSSNIIHQGAKINSDYDRHKFIEWAYEYESALCGLPKEDMTILLTIPPNISQQLMTKRYSGDESKKDIHESNVAYLEKCYNMLGDTVRYINKHAVSNWKWLDCCDYERNTIKTIEQISEDIMKLIRPVIQK